MSTTISTIGTTVASIVVSSTMVGAMRIAVGEAGVRSPQAGVSRRRWRRSSGSQKSQNGYGRADYQSQRAIVAIGGRRDMEAQDYPDEHYQGQ